MATLVSVIVPVYNRARFLRDALESIYSQTYRSFEVVVVDDGSTDDSAEVARSFPGVRCLTQTNQGVSVARNVGIQATRGELVAFLDSDDIWLPEKLQMQVDYLHSFLQVDYCLTYVKNFLEPGCACPAWLPARWLDEERPSMGTSTLLTRRRVLNRIGLFDPSLKIGEDTDWLLRAQNAGHVHMVLRQLLLLRRVHADNLSAQSSPADWLTVAKGALQRKRA